MSIEERRDAVLATLAEGALFPGEIHGRLPAVSKSTIMNDLYALRSQGKAETCAGGWQMKTAAPESEDAAQPAESDPLAQSRRSPMSSAS